MVSLIRSIVTTDGKNMISILIKFIYEPVFLRYSFWQGSFAYLFSANARFTVRLVKIYSLFRIIKRTVLYQSLWIIDRLKN